MKKKIVVISGAGLDRESGIKTFRDEDGLWNGYKVEDVAHKSAWKKNKNLVLEFYNTRRDELGDVDVNDAHKLLASLEDKYDVVHVTQNVSDLLERAGCSNVIHLHGQLDKMRCSGTDEVYDWPHGKNIEVGDKSPNGSQLRPHIVWFGENVPNMVKAYKEVDSADIVIVVGTSMQVYPAASLCDTNYLSDKDLYLVNPDDNAIVPKGFTFINKVATEGVKELIDLL